MCVCNAWGKENEIKELVQTHIELGMDEILRVHRKWRNVIKFLKRIIMFITAYLHACMHAHKSMCFLPGDMFARHP